MGKGLDDLERHDLLQIALALGLSKHHLGSHTGFELPGGVVELSAEDRELLRSDHPSLVDLRERYRVQPAAAAPPQWNQDNLSAGLDLRRFREDNVYVWQQRALALDIRYIVTAQYVVAHDELGLRHRLDEDAAFGAYTVDVDGWIVSRDLLDSIVQLTFLARTLGVNRWSGLGWLDIGAGYGRLAHRAVAAFPQMARFLCTDAVAESTFLCDYYLRHRRIQHRAASVPLDQIEQTLSSQEVHVASNIQSFSECSLASIEWWIELLARHRVRYLFIEPNERDHSDELTCQPRRSDGQWTPYHQVLHSHGYRRIAAEPKYAGSAATQAYGVYPGRFHLFELR